MSSATRAKNSLTATCCSRRMKWPGMESIAQAAGVSIMIDPETRDIVQTVYIRRVEKIDGLLYNVEFDRYPDVKDPGKQN